LAAELGLTVLVQSQITTGEAAAVSEVEVGVRMLMLTSVLALSTIPVTDTRELQ
jgi:hypothetical protein